MKEEGRISAEFVRAERWRSVCDEEPRTAPESAVQAPRGRPSRPSRALPGRAAGAGRRGGAAVVLPGGMGPRRANPRKKANGEEHQNRRNPSKSKNVCYLSVLSFLKKIVISPEVQQTAIEIDVECSHFSQREGLEGTFQRTTPSSCRRTLPPAAASPARSAAAWANRF